MPTLRGCAIDPSLAPGLRRVAGERFDELPNTNNNEGEIRRNPIEADLVECMVALPGQLFTTPKFRLYLRLTKDKTGGNGKAHRRKGEVLFIDAR